MSSIDPSNLKKMLALSDSAYKSNIKKVSKNGVFRFSFNYLIKNLLGFDCDLCPNHRITLTTVLSILKDFSSRNMDSIKSNVDHSHLITEEELIKRGHQNIVDAFNSIGTSNFLQLGTSEKGNTNRVFGFLDNSEPHLFHVCLIDHSHKIYPPQSKVFRTTSPTS